MDTIIINIPAWPLLILSFLLTISICFEIRKLWLSIKLKKLSENEEKV